MGLEELAGNYGLEQPPMLMSPAAAPAPAAAPGAQAVTPVVPSLSPETGRLDLAALLDKYNSGQSSYAQELAAARNVASRETQAFHDLIQRSMDQAADTPPSKAEMYFRLAAAFGAPTKTGAFTENLGLAGKEMAELQKDEREASRRNLAMRTGLALEGQKAKLLSSKEDLTTLRGLAAEEMKDKRAIAVKMLDEYISSGKPQSDAGKQAKDMGFTPGTPEYTAKVNQLVENGINAKLAQINATLTQANAAMIRAGVAEQQATRLGPQEVKLKSETEDSIANLNSAANILRQVYRLNPNTFDTSAPDTVQRKALELAGSKDPKVIATREMENLLKSEMITSAAEKMKGVLSDSDIKLLQSVQGLDAKSREERAKIVKNAYERIKAAHERQTRRLNEINAGLYRSTSPVGSLD